MPHSSGGGSHGGGSHGGSGFGGVSRPTYSNRPFPGGTRYVYYSRTGVMHTYYGTAPRTKMSLASLVFSLVMLSIFALPLFFTVLSSARFTPSKITASYNTKIVIEDKISIVDIETIENSFESFQDITGVTPALEVVSKEYVDKHYSSLETFAYSEYLRMFDDEYHWLFVIAVPEDYKTAEFVDWEWEGMIGDDVGQVIDESSEDNMTEIMHKNLLRLDADKITSAVAKAFNEYSGEVMDSTVHVEMYLLAGFIVIVYCIIAAYQIYSYVSLIGTTESKPVKEGAKQYACEYCGCMYISGSVSVCPHCGAAIPAHSED